MDLSQSPNEKLISEALSVLVLNMPRKGEFMNPLISQLAGLADAKFETGNLAEDKELAKIVNFLQKVLPHVFNDEIRLLVKQLIWLLESQMKANLVKLGGKEIQTYPTKVYYYYRCGKKIIIYTQLVIILDLRPGPMPTVWKREVIFNETGVVVDDSWEKAVVNPDIDNFNPPMQIVCN